MVAVDPLASLRITSTYVTLGDHVFEVEKHAADDWLEIIISGQLYRVLPGWVEGREDAQLMMDMLMDGTISEEDIDRATKDVISTVGGRHSWWIFNLLGFVVGSWAIINGHMIRGGLFAEDISLSAWIDAAYSVCIELQPSNDERQKFETQLEAPPAGTELDEEEEGQAFLALMDSM